MNKFFVFVMAVLLCSVFVSAISPLNPPVFKIVNVPDPLIVVTFVNESLPVNITGWVLVKGSDASKAELASSKVNFSANATNASNVSNVSNISSLIIPLNLPVRSESAPWSFNFTPRLILEETNYTFRIVAEDVFGNSAVFYDFFKVAKVAFNLTLVEPPFEVASSSSFNIKIKTTHSSDCRFNKFDVGFDDSLRFASSDGILHSVGYSLNAPNVSYPFFVYCKNGKGEVSKAVFNLSYDPTKPVLQPLKVVNAFSNVISEPSRRAEVEAVTDELSRCYYSLDDGSFKLASENFSISHSIIESDLSDFRTHSFKVYCVNKAGLESNRESVNVLVNSSASIGFEIVSPKAFVSSLSVDFIIRTSKSSDCSLVFNGSTDDLVESADHKSHTFSRTFSSDGKKSMFLVCDFLRTFPNGTAGSDSIKEKFEFVIDSSKPVIQNVTDEGITSSLTTLSAVIFADDPESGIVKYYYSIRSSFGLSDIVNWTESSGRDVKVSGLNLTDGSTYVFDAIVTNGAGANSSLVSSGGVRIDTSYTGTAVNASLINQSVPPLPDINVSRPENAVDDLARRPLNESAVPVPVSKGFGLFTWLLLVIAVVLLGAGGWAAWQFTQRKAPTLPARPVAGSVLSRPSASRPSVSVPVEQRPVVKQLSSAERAKSSRRERKSMERDSLFDSFMPSGKKESVDAKSVKSAVSEKRIERSESIERVKKVERVERAEKPLRQAKVEVSDFDRLSAVDKRDDLFDRISSLPAKKVDNAFDSLAKVDSDFERLSKVYKEKGEDKAFDAIERLSSKKQHEVLDSLNDLIERKKKR